MLRGDLVNRGIMRQESGYYVIRQSMPYPLKETNVFLIESGDGWVIIDVGVDLDSTRQVWELAVRELGISFKQIQRIYVTHCHPDHLGAARWLQQCCDAPVYMLREEIERARKFVFLDENNFSELYRQAIYQEMKINRFPDHKMNELITDWYEEVRPLYLEPAEILPLEVGDKIDLHGDMFQVIQAAGHSDGQCMFWCPQLQHLFLADVLAAGAYLHFTDWPNTQLQNPLEKMFDLIELMKGLGVIRAFPGHGPLIEDLDYQLDILSRKHQRILNKVESTIRYPVSAGDLYPQIWGENDYVHFHRVAMGETLGYLNYLVSRNKLKRNYDGDLAIYLPLGTIKK